MKNIPLLLGTIVGTLVLIIAIAFSFSGGASVTEDGQVVVDLAVVMGESRHVKSLKTDAMVETETMESTDEAVIENDVITIVEFSDFQCPACKSVLPLVDAVMNQYPENIELVYRHFPLDQIHPNARLAAVAAEAVSVIDSEKFFDMHDLLFANQSAWSKITSRSELKDVFATYAEELSIDRNEFIERIEDNSVADLVQLDSNTATKLGVNSTPTFFVNGIKTSAPQLMLTVESLINNNE